MERLRALTALSGLAGQEDRVIAYLRDQMSGADEVQIDRMGNVCAFIRGTDPAGPTVMVFAHSDELGLVVKRIDEAGFLRVERLGGVPERGLPGLRVVVHGSRGDLPGVVGAKSHHLTPVEEKYQALPVGKLYVDIGARTRDEAQAMGVRVGTGITYAPAFERLGPDLISAKTLDNRAGCWTLLRLLDAVKENRPPCNVWLVSPVQEEFNLQGLFPAANRIRPDLAICIDISAAADTPELAGSGEVALGKGPVITTYSFHGRGTLAGLLPNPKLVDFVGRAAAEAAIPHQYGVLFGGLTDASYLHLIGDGIPAIDIGFPCRYTHFPVETCSLGDLDHTLQLLIEVLGRLDRLPDLTRGSCS